MINITAQQKSIVSSGLVFEETVFKLYPNTSNRSNRIYDANLVAPLEPPMGDPRKSLSWAMSNCSESNRDQVNTLHGANSFLFDNQNQSLYQTLMKHTNGQDEPHISKNVERLTPGRKYVFSFYYKRSSLFTRVLNAGVYSSHSAVSPSFGSVIIPESFTGDSAWVRAHASFVASTSGGYSSLPEDICIKFSTPNISGRFGTIRIACPMIHEDVQYDDLTWLDKPVPYCPLEPFINYSDDDSIELDLDQSGFSVRSQAQFDLNDGLSLPSGSIVAVNSDMDLSPTRFDDDFDISAGKIVGPRQRDGYGSIRSGNRVVGFNKYLNGDGTNFYIPIGVFTVSGLSQSIDDGSLSIDLSSYWSDLSEECGVSSVLLDKSYSDILEFLVHISGYNADPMLNLVKYSGFFYLSKIFVANSSSNVSSVISKIAEANAKSVWVGQDSAINFKQISDAPILSGVTITPDNSMQGGLKPEISDMPEAVTIKSDPISVTQTMGNKVDPTQQSGNIDQDKLSDGRAYAYELGDSNVLNPDDIDKNGNVGFDNLFDGTTGVISHPPYLLGSGNSSKDRDESFCPYLEIDLGLGASPVSLLHLWMDSRNGENYLFKVKVSLDRERWWYIAGDAKNFAETNENEFEDHKTAISGFPTQFARYVRFYFNGTIDQVYNRIFDIQIFRNSFQSSLLGWSGSGSGTVAIDTLGIRSWRNENHCEDNLTFELRSKTGRVRINGIGDSDESDPILGVRGLGIGGFKIYDGGVSSYNCDGEKTFHIDTEAGDVCVVGDITATSGCIGGWCIKSNCICAGNTSIKSNGNITGNYVPGVSGWSMGSDGNAELSNALVRGEIYASRGNIGGWSIHCTEGLSSGSAGTRIVINPGVGMWMGEDLIGSAPFSVTNAGALKSTSGLIGGWTLASTSLSSTNIGIYSGTSNTARFEVGTGATAGGMNSANAIGDIAFWAGNTHANRETAPFRVTAGGALTATNATITGTITATLGAIGGFTIAATTLTAGATTSAVGMSSTTTCPAFWAGNVTAASAPFWVTHAGAIKAHSGDIAGLVLAAGSLTATNLGIYSGDANTARVQVGASTYIAGINSPNTTTDITFWSGNTHVNRGIACFRVNGLGEVTAHSGNIGGWTIASKYLCSTNLLICPTGGMETKDFMSGLKGWRINQTGNVEFNNAIIRGELRSAMFVYDEVSAVGGQALIANAGTLKVCATTASALAGSFDVCIDDPKSAHAARFAVNDILRVKTFNGTNIVDAWGRVSAVVDVTTYYRYCVVLCSGSLSAVIPEGTAVVSYGPVATGGGILLDGQSSNSPFMDIFTNTATPWTSLQGRVRLGNLSGISGFSTCGYGLWTDNGLIVGGVVRSNNWATGAGSCFDLALGCFAMGGSSNPKLSWDGTTLNVSGNIAASAGSDFRSALKMPSGEVGYWTAKGATTASIAVANGVKDISGNAKHGQAFGGATVVDSEVGKAFSFDGTDDHARFEVFQQSPISMSIWAKISSSQISKTLIKIGDTADSTNRSTAIITDDSGNLQAYVFDGIVKETTSTAFPTGSMVNIVVTATSGDQLRLYVNGAFVSEVAVNTLWADGTGIVLARNGSSYFGGQLANIRVYNRALTAAEVQTLYLLGTQEESGTITGDRVVTGAIKSLNYSTTLGSYFDLDGGNFHLGGSSAPKLSWNGTTLAVDGTVCACAGCVGCFSIDNGSFLYNKTSSGAAVTVIYNNTITGQTWWNCSYTSGLYMGVCTTDTGDPICSRIFINPSNGVDEDTATLRISQIAGICHAIATNGIITGGIICATTCVQSPILCATTYLGGPYVYSTGNISSFREIGADDNVRNGIVSYDSTAMAINVGGQIVLGYKYTTEGNYTEGAIIKMYKEDGVGGNYGSGIRFQVRNHGANLSTKMTLNPSGQVGIGVAPLYPLHVDGIGCITTCVQSAHLYSTGVVHAGTCVCAATRVGVAVAPLYPLHVTGVGCVTTCVQSPIFKGDCFCSITGALAISKTTLHLLTLDESNLIVNVSCTGDDASVYKSPVQIYAPDAACWGLFVAGRIYVTSVTCPSDRNLKTDIQQVSVMDTLRKLPVTMWRFKDSKDYQIGPMAQDFNNLFRLSHDWATNLTVSGLDGIALRAVKEVDECVMKQDACISKYENCIIKHDDCMGMLESRNKFLENEIFDLKEKINHLIK